MIRHSILVAGLCKFVSVSNSQFNSIKIRFLLKVYTQKNRAQDLLKRRLILEDNFTWIIPTTTTTKSSSQFFVKEDDDIDSNELIRYVGGVDLSFSKDDSSIACASIVVLDLLQIKNDGCFQVVYEDYKIVHLQIPYIPGFLAFREAPVLLELLEKMKHECSPFYPQCLMVDGNGLLHPRGFGLACFLGVTADIPTIGIGKNLHHVDGLTQSGVREFLEAEENCSKDLITLTGCSGRIWGAALRSTNDSLKPIYVSIGHRISLESAIKLVRFTCKYRVPEPVRQADIRSRNFLQKNQGIM
ncbi:endonuclease V isoform X1 [Papaver somniferum]|uniref:endonuclease V isoform X1 n=1 Tax=Papaver somniferum TaxID=3469 RepID=UPI000E6FD21C|nr:endonuclease V isoform X1 [Papaver somniferum]